MIQEVKLSPSVCWTHSWKPRQGATPPPVEDSPSYVTAAQSGSNKHHFLGMLKEFYRDQDPMAN